MSIHHIPENTLNEDVYSAPLSKQSLPKYRMPNGSSDPRVVYSAIHDELLLDGNARQNLATFCTTWVEDEVRKLMDESIDKNMIDKDEYPQTAEIENRCVHILADIWHAKRSGTAIGCSTTGSSEAAMLGGLAMKWKWRAQRQAAGKSSDKPNIVVGPVQICWKKFARYFDVELRQIPLQKGASGMLPEQLKDYVDENTIGVVATLGVTYTGAYEPVAEIAKELDKIEAEHGWDIPIHVDAASGGFIAPFIQPDLEWDFKIPRVRSINASGHKFGMAPLGCGWVVWSEKENLPEDLIFYVDYLGGNMPTFALNFSRPGGEIIAQYYNFLRLGREGYTQIQQTCAETAQWFAAEIAKIGCFELVYDGKDGIPAVAYKLTDGDHGFTLYDLSERVRMRGWQIASYPLPADREDTIVQRVLVRHGVSRDLCDLLLEDIKRAIDDLKVRGARGGDAKPGFCH